MYKLIWFIGKRSKLVRRLFYKYSEGIWLWGVINFVRDNPGGVEPTPVTEEGFTEACDWIKKHVEEIFKL